MKYIVTGALAAALATNGTLTISYPDGTDAGEFINGAKHKLGVNYDIFTFPQDFTLSFGASSITLTYLGATTLPAGSPFRFELNGQGVAAYRDITTGSLLSKTYRMVPFMVNFGAPDILDADGISASQSVTGVGTAFLLNGAILGTYGAATRMILDCPRNVVAAWTGAAVITITGKDVYGNTMKEVSASGTSHTGKKAFKEITSITTSASITGATVGTADVLGFPVAIPTSANILDILKNGVAIGKPAGTQRLNWFGEQVSVLAGSTAAIELIAPFAGYLNTLAVAVRAAVTTGGAVTVKIGTTDVTGLSVTVADGATKGTTATDTPTTPYSATTVVAKGDRIQIVFADAFATAGALDGYIELVPSDGLSSGVFVPALLATKQTSTSADVRGTIDMDDALDGSAVYQAMVMLADPGNIGNPQYTG